VPLLSTFIDRLGDLVTRTSSADITSSLTCPRSARRTSDGVQRAMVNPRQRESPAMIRSAGLRIANCAGE